jgi:hypothetical protein
MDDSQSPLIVAIASRPYQHLAVNGDQPSVQWSDEACTVAVIDGLGHGPDAAHAAYLAIESLAAQPGLPPGEAIIRCHTALSGSRGAAMAVARVELVSGRMTFAAVGNVEAQFWNGTRVKRPIAQRGIVGGTLPRIREQEMSLDVPDWLLLLYSDGIRQRFTLEHLPEFIVRDAQALADHILNDWSRQTDDATIVVVMPRAPR